MSVADTHVGSLPVVIGVEDVASHTEVRDFDHKLVSDEHVSSCEVTVDALFDVRHTLILSQQHATSSVTLIYDFSITRFIRIGIARRHSLERTERRQILS